METLEPGSSATDADPGTHDHHDGYIHRKDDYLKRLRRIEGQARGLQRMVEDEEYCIDILTQVSAMTKALDPGAWRLFADFTPTALGENLTLGADLAVPGECSPAPLPPETLTAEVDGFTVVLTGSLEPGQESELTLSVRREGRPVTDLQPYLGAFGHLVVLRDGDLAYLHAHPVDEADGVAATSGPHIRFATTAPSAGDYRLLLDFKHDGVVRTAAFTASAGAQEESHG